MDHGEFRHPRLATVYDVAYPWSVADDFFLSIVNERPGSRALDLGCGTGRLAIAMARAGHLVTGVDPAAASLEIARRKPGADAVTFLEGTSSVLASDSFDVALMTSHVAQFVLDDDWPATLRDIHRALVPGGRLAFDTRDPRARGWEAWTPEQSRLELHLPHGESVVTWVDVTSVDGPVDRPLVSFEHRYEFGDGQRLAATATMVFRSEQDVRASLAQAGFTVEAIYGGWQRQPVGAADGELLVLATAGPSAA